MCKGQQGKEVIIKGEVQVLVVKLTSLRKIILKKNHLRKIILFCAIMITYKNILDLKD